MYWVIARKQLENLEESKIQLVGSEDYFRVYPSSDVADKYLDELRSNEKRSSFIILEISIETTGRMTQPQDMKK